MNDTDKAVRKAGWSKRTKLICTDVVAEAFANSMQSSEAGKDLWYCPKFKICAYTFVLTYLHQQRSKSPQRELINLNEAAS